MLAKISIPRKAAEVYAKVATDLKSERRRFFSVSYMTVGFEDAWIT